jgi:hypothetical protein
MLTWLLDLSTPEAAVRSYLEWISYAYRIGDSETATHTMTPEEAVRVDSCAELNRQKARLIDQHLVAFREGATSVGETQTILAAREDWQYRSVSLGGLCALKPPYTTSYEATTYTLVLVRPGRWLVDSVDVKPLGEVK